MLSAWKDAVATHLHDRASRLIACIGLFVTLGLCLLGVYLILALRDAAWRQAELGATNMLGVIEQAVARNVEMYDLSLRAVAEEARTPIFGDLPPPIRRLALFDRSSTAAGLGTILIVDAEGRVELSSIAGTPSTVSFADLPEFLDHKANPDLGLVMGVPRTSRVSGRQVVPMSRRIVSPGGAFTGIVSGAIRLDYLQTLFARLTITSGSALNLFLADGTLLARSPYKPENIGRSIAAGEPYRRFQTERRGLFVSNSAIDGVERLYAFAHIDDFPLIVDVAVGVDSITAVWRPKAVMIGTLMAGLILMTLSLTWLLHREIVRRAAAEASSRTANAELAALARTDSLTGLPNRRRYDEVFAAEWRRAVRTGASLSLLLLDTDHFKRFNDHFGHHTGDGVLQAVAACLRDLLDPRDAIACRIGGEEFAVILPCAGEAEARACAERIRRAVVGLQIPHAPEVGGVATISVGVAHAAPSSEAVIEHLFAQADAALYEAKRAGRNRVRVGAQEASARPAALSA